MKRLFAGALLALAVAGCGSMAATGPVVDNAAAQRAVFKAEGDYKLALIVANVYVKLPLCTAAKPPCATLAVVRQIQRAQPVARSAIDAAESAVRTPGFGADVVSSAVTAANASLGAFVSITNTLK